MRFCCYFAWHKINISIEVFMKPAYYYNVSIAYIVGRTTKKGRAPSILLTYALPFVLSNLAFHM